MDHRNHLFYTRDRLMFSSCLRFSSLNGVVLDDVIDEIAVMCIFPAKRVISELTDCRAIPSMKLKQSRNNIKQPRGYGLSMGSSALP